MLFYIHFKSPSLPTLTQKPSGVLKHFGFVRTPTEPTLVGVPWST